uniref:Uncharacterized protein n=1 Tax=Monodon monoceros TaxID=40151 RepID=A0A8C6B823_MONMO
MLRNCKHLKMWSELGREVCSPTLRTITALSIKTLSEGRESMIPPWGMKRLRVQKENIRKPAEPAKEIISSSLHLKFIYF